MKYHIALNRIVDGIKRFMSKRQNNKCAICNVSLNEEVYGVLDHCHFTGYCRQVLCSLCNTGLGSFKDSPERLKAAVRYLGRDYSGNPPHPAFYKEPTTITGLAPRGLGFDYQEWLEVHEL